MKASCVQHSKSEQLVLLRAGYLDLCDGDHAAACLLAVFEYWHNVRLAQNEQERVRARSSVYRPRLSLWIFKSYEHLVHDLLGLYGRTKVVNATQRLVRKGFLICRSNPRNPNDRTTQYQFRPENVNAALAARDRSRAPELSSELDDGRSEMDNERSEADGGDRSEIARQRSEVNDVFERETTWSEKGSKAAEEDTGCPVDALPKHPEEAVFDSAPFPDTSRAIRERFAEADEKLIRDVVQRCRDRLAARGKPPELATDELIARAVIRCRRPQNRQFSAALYLKTVPQCIETWLAKEESTSQAWEPEWLKDADEEAIHSWRKGGNDVHE